MTLQGLTLQEQKVPACQPNPPTLSEIEFCNIDRTELTSEVLSAMKKSVKPVGRNLVQSNISKKEDDKNKKAKKWKICPSAVKGSILVSSPLVWLSTLFYLVVLLTC